MKSDRKIVLSLIEVEEAVKAFIRRKYHEKLGDADHLTEVCATNSASIEFHFEKES